MSPSQKHEWVEFENHTFSLKNTEVGEPMHSSIGPWAEASRIYVEQSALEARLQTDVARPLVVYDVGMGIAANALAAAQCQSRLGDRSRRPLHIVSFEKEPSGLAMALEHPERLPFLQGWEAPLRQLLQEKLWKSPDGTLTWELRTGDFLALPLGEPAPEIVFYDFYSPKTSAPLWTVEVFRKVLAACRKAPEGSLLLTYSAATPIRVAMLLAGFYVGRGVRTGAKNETTIASTRLEDLADPLGPEWLEKLKRSTKVYPQGQPELPREETLRLIQECPQFRL